ncbi:MAG: class I SAM-dependent methyltransferase [Kineosporiaceae bacterium]
MGEEAAGWAEALARWGVPEEIRAQAPADPWVLPVELFRASAGEPVATVSLARAREALPPAGTVLDVGCGGGRASLALVPPAGHLTGVDRSPQMLAALAEAADATGVSHTEIKGSWPEAGERTPVADVAVCHHVAYNVADLGTFARALADHARRRVVLELTGRHPTAWLSPLWQRFWGLTRPAGPTARDALAVLVEAGLPARLETWQDDTPRGVLTLSPAGRVAFVRTRLCLPADRDPEVADALAALPLGEPRPMATIWWDSTDQS